jgi:hypothetical protein
MSRSISEPVNHWRPEQNMAMRIFGEAGQDNRTCHRRSVGEVLSVPVCVALYDRESVEWEGVAPLRKWALGQPRRWR